MTIITGVSSPFILGKGRGDVAKEQGKMSRDFGIDFL